MNAAVSEALGAPRKPRAIIPRSRVPGQSLFGKRGAAARLAWRAGCALLLRILPARPHGVIHGWPDDEGNAIEVLRALRRRYRGTIYWLMADVTYPGPAFAAAELADAGRIVRLRKDSARAALLALTAEVTFFTHGLFTAVPPPPTRLVVNLWHGDGPKRVSGTQSIRSTVVLAGTRLWGARREQRFLVPPSSIAVVGNPRMDQFHAAPAANVLAALGLDPGKKTVLWLPTYRAASASHGRSWRDAAGLSASDDVARIAEVLASAAAARSVQLLVKPHPLDADSYDHLGVRTIDHGALRAAGVTLYQLLGAADAIISDISSVWVDYMALDRPIGFYVPDLEDLQNAGKLTVDDLDALVPGPRIRTAEDAAQFIHTIVDAPDSVRPSRFPGTARIGLVGERGAADRLLDWLDEFQQARGRDMLFQPDSARATGHQSGPKAARA